MYETTIFVTWASMGEGCLAVGIGELMGRVSYNWLIYGMLLMDLAIYVLVRTNRSIMADGEDETEKSISVSISIKNAKKIKNKYLMEMTEMRAGDNPSMALQTGLLSEIEPRTRPKGDYY